MPSRRKTLFATLVVSTNMILVAAPAHAAVTPATSPSELSTAMSSASAGVTIGTYEVVPAGELGPTGTPNGTADSPLTTFPTDGETFAILTSGDVTLADDPNSSGSSGADLGSAARGAFDVTVLQVDLTVPPLGPNCLRVDFRFLSEEFPEFVDSAFNDGFIAELDPGEGQEWSVSGSEIIAPDNFAFDSEGNVVSINSSGVASMSADEAVGTTYDGATPQLVAQTPITAGVHSVYFSIFDAGDGVLDSAVFLDNLSLGTETAGGCEPGVISETAADLSIVKTDEPDPVTAGGALLYTLTVANAGPDDATNVAVVDTLPAETTFESVEAGEGWICDDTEGETGTVVTCTTEVLAAETTAPDIEILVSTSSSIEGESTVITNVADVSADEPDPDLENNQAVETTTVEAQSTPDFASEFCPDGCTVTTDTGNGASPGDPTVTTVIVPDEADPQTVTITEAAAATLPTFCGGQTCSGQLVTISDITGVTNPSDPIIVEITYDKTVKGGSQVYILKPDFTSPQLVRNCTTPGVASPRPCVSSKTVLANGDRMFRILMLSGDPILGKK